MQHAPGSSRVSARGSAPVVTAALLAWTSHMCGVLLAGGISGLVGQSQGVQGEYRTSTLSRHDRSSAAFASLAHTPSSTA